MNKLEPLTLNSPATLIKRLQTAGGGKSKPKKYKAPSTPVGKSKKAPSALRIQLGLAGNTTMTNRFVRKAQKHAQRESKYEQKTAMIKADLQKSADSVNATKTGIRRSSNIKTELMGYKYVDSALKKQPYIKQKKKALKQELRASIQAEKKASKLLKHSANIQSALKKYETKLAKAKARKRAYESAYTKKQEQKLAKKKYRWFGTQAQKPISQEMDGVKLKMGSINVKVGEDSVPLGVLKTEDIRNNPKLADEVFKQLPQLRSFATRKDPMFDFTKFDDTHKAELAGKLLEHIRNPLPGQQDYHEILKDINETAFKNYKDTRTPYGIHLLQQQKLKAYEELMAKRKADAESAKRQSHEVEVKIIGPTSFQYPQPPTPYPYPNTNFNPATQRFKDPDTRGEAYSTTSSSQSTFPATPDSREDLEALYGDTPSSAAYYAEGKPFQPKSKINRGGPYIEEIEEIYDKPDIKPASTESSTIRRIEEGQYNMPKGPRTRAGSGEYAPVDIHPEIAGGRNIPSGIRVSKSDTLEPADIEALYAKPNKPARTTTQTDPVYSAVNPLFAARNQSAMPAMQKSTTGSMAENAGYVESTGIKAGAGEYMDIAPIRNSVNSDAKGEYMTLEEVSGVRGNKSPANTGYMNADEFRRGQRSSKNSINTSAGDKGKYIDVESAGVRGKNKSPTNTGYMDLDEFRSSQLPSKKSNNTSAGDKGQYMDVESAGDKRSAASKNTYMTLGEVSGRNKSNSLAADAGYMSANKFRNIQQPGQTQTSPGANYPGAKYIQIESRSKPEYAVPIRNPPATPNPSKGQYMNIGPRYATPKGTPVNKPAGTNKTTTSQAKTNGPELPKKGEPAYSRLNPRPDTHNTYMSVNKSKSNAGYVNVSAGRNKSKNAGYVNVSAGRKKTKKNESPYMTVKSTTDPTYMKVESVNDPAYMTVKELRGPKGMPNDPTYMKVAPKSMSKRDDPAYMTVNEIRGPDNNGGYMEINPN